MKFNLKGKVAVVTGGGSGIGKAISITLAENGAYVHILEQNLKDAAVTLEEIQKEKGVAEIHRCNVALKEDVFKTISKVGKNNNIDILINNAGIGHIGNIEKTNEVEFDKVYNVNVKGVYNCIQAAIPFMKIKGGVIINMASIAAKAGIKNRFAYSMSKGAVLSMTYSVAKDYLLAGIRCNSISPARIHTPFVDGYLDTNFPDSKDEKFKELSQTQPIGRMGKPDEVANLAIYLCSDEASFITGSDFAIDGGFITLNGD